MKLALAMLLAACAATAAHADITNEAVRTLADGRVVAEPPPGPKSGRARKPLKWDDVWRADYFPPTYLIQTAQGWQECPWTWLDATCRPYVPGRDKRARGWVLKVGGEWRICPRRDTLTGCRDYYSPLPPTAVQD